MEYKIIISTAAENDTKESYIFYEKEQPGLGKRFLNELAENYNKLKLHPTHYSFVSAEKITCALSLKKFHFTIIFQIDRVEVYVFAIYHFRKRPSNF